MTQYNLPVFASPTPGRTFLKDNMEPWRDAVHSMHAGVTRPDYVVPQMMWIDTSATPWVLKVFQGSNDIILGNLDPVTLLFTPSAVDGSTVTGILASNVAATNTSGLSGTNVQLQLNELAANPYATFPIGIPFPVIHSSLIPNNSGTRKFILLSAGHTGSGQYNEGLISQTVGGTFPTNTATGEILVGSLTGVMVDLINSTRRAIIGGETQSIENDQMQSITGAVGRISFLGGSATQSGALSAIDAGDSVNYSISPGNPSRNISLNSANSPGARTGTYTRGRGWANIHYMRIV